MNKSYGSGEIIINGINRAVIPACNRRRDPVLPCIVKLFQTVTELHGSGGDNLKMKKSGVICLACDTPC